MVVTGGGVAGGGNGGGVAGGGNGGGVAGTLERCRTLTMLFALRISSMTVRLAAGEPVTR